ncbi:hypothetical protein [Microbacterium dauci]|uniref:Uncharacterized protein n=1 Tax=Microbacterium dauci TaxID=3048008 RepID=A0ABT6ZDC9_9MICO|nr:hypothetical protein [Microbacterium sp. LX3-4]MDJ1114164.1 hypothetical protein [Microbacterium sp. LX3-4]
MSRRMLDVSDAKFVATLPGWKATAESPRAWNFSWRLVRQAHLVVDHQNTHAPSVACAR